ncbi:hypothetical protein NUM_43830 [Actinocatenispora comari]|uniref:DUF5753 domain-containing protein n=1 Tax=Actinocatenispora comari TaxID=2807577 RepID=A0A8J4AD19_9ACTN|nr:hypothetical protein NUM_43830 [Actinocatenispora comari]
MQVIPCDGWIAHRGQPRFELLEFDHPAAPPIVVSHLTGYPPESLYDPAEVEPFRALASRLADAASSPDQATVILGRAIDRLRNGPISLLDTQ